VSAPHDEALARALELAIREIREQPGPSLEVDEALERALIATRGEVFNMVKRVGDALHAAGLAPSSELAEALLYLAGKIANDERRKAART
jgi:hypothetical protein